MDLIQTPDRQFTDGTRRVPGTPVPAWWLNGLQGELAHVIESAGIELDKSRSDQLLDALRAWVAKDAAANVVSVAALKLMQATPGMVVQVQGYHADKTIGGGLFTAVSASSVDSKIDDGIYISGNGIAWVRICNDVQPEYFGARADGIADDTAALLAAAAAATKIKRTLRGGGKYKLTQALNLRELPVDMPDADFVVSGDGQI
ncbi:hypothetical protein ACEPPX_10475, partial [Neisseria sp. S1]